MRKLMLVSAAVVLALSSCGGGGSGSKELTPQERLADAKKGFDQADFIGVTLETKELPAGLDALLRAQGTGTHDPAFTGEVKVQAALPFTAPLIAVDDKVYAQLPFAGWSVVDPADYGAPDPAALMDTGKGISSLFTATKEPTAGGSERSGKEVLTSINGTLPGESVQQVFPSSGTGDFSVTYTLTADNDVRSVTMTGPFYDGSDAVTYTMDLDLDADPVDIKAPI